MGKDNIEGQAKQRKHHCFLEANTVPVDKVGIQMISATIIKLHKSMSLFDDKVGLLALMYFARTHMTDRSDNLAYNDNVITHCRTY